MGRIVLSKDAEKESDMKIKLENGMYANLYLKNDPLVLNFVISEAALKDNIEFRKLCNCIFDDKLHLKLDILDDEKGKTIIRQNFNLRLNKWLKFKNLNQLNASIKDIEEAFYVFYLECMANIRKFVIDLYKDELIKEILEYYHGHCD